MRKSLGISGLQKQARTKEEFNRAGEELGLKQLQLWSSQLDKFRENLQDFASKYRIQIKKDPVFRAHFQKMCSSIGVDPLASNKGFWADLLGIGDFYYELGIQIAEISLATRDRNGGLLSFNDLQRFLRANRQSQAEITEEDIVRSVKNLQVLGNGYGIIEHESGKMLQSLPRETNMDLILVIEMVTGNKFVTEADLCRLHSWTRERAENTLNLLLKEGIFWIDTQSSPTEYWMNTDL